ncbi:MAG: ABC transporter ATP-binding protein [Crocinitomicaceae bacterium]|nr:ABC transporter ATP-binding protein [Crocinitomicaceae bacterium]
MSQTGNKSISPGQRFWMLLKPDKSEISALYIYAIFNGLIYLALPLGIQSIINFIQGGQVSTSWIILTSFVLAAVFLSGLMSIYQMRITENIEQKIFSRASFEFAYRLPRLSETVKKKFFLPELANRFVETISLQKGITKILIDFSSAIVQIAFGMLVLSFYHPFFIIYIAFSFLVIYVLFRFTVQRGLQTSLEESKHKYKLIFWLQEIGRAAGSFKSAGYPDHPMNKTNDHLNNYVDAREKHFNILKRQYWLLVIFKVLIIGGLLLIGGLLVIQQQMNIGQFVAAEIIILLMMSSVEKLILTMRNIYDVLTALEKIGFVTDMDIEQADDKMKMEFCDDSGAELTIENLALHNNEPNKTEKLVYNLHAASGSKLLLQGKMKTTAKCFFIFWPVTTIIIPVF